MQKEMYDEKEVKKIDERKDDDDYSFSFKEAMTEVSSYDDECIERDSKYNDNDDDASKGKNYNLF